MNRKVLLLGCSGKMGVAIGDVFASDYCVTGKNTGDFDAQDLKQVRELIDNNSPDIVINSVAFLGIDSCEKEPEKAFKLNTLYPKLLAELSRKKGFLLVHFSTDAVFNNDKRDFYTEEDCPSPLNIYGITKYGGDCSIKAIAKRYYIFRVPILFGETNKNSQFVEKMLEKIKAGQKVLRIADDIISSPTYAKDVAREIKRILKIPHPYGLYHIANAGKASLFELMNEIVKNINLDIKIEKASYRDFQFIGVKHLYTPIKSKKTSSLRPWRKAVLEYCRNIKNRL